MELADGIKKSRVLGGMDHKGEFVRGSVGIKAISVLE